MTAKKAYSRYRQATVETASPGKLVVMLYDGALRFLREAVEHLEASRPKEGHFAIVRAENIVCELMSSLDFEQGGQIAKNLYAIYEFVYMHLVEGNIHKDTKRINEVIGLLSELREAWAQAVEVHSKELFQARAMAGQVAGSLATQPAPPPPPPPPVKRAPPIEPPDTLPEGGFSIVS
jgi:flagellar protein FliS